MKTLKIEVEGKEFDEDFKSKLQKALNQAFGDISLKFEGNGEDDDEDDEDHKGPMMDKMKDITGKLESLQSQLTEINRTIRGAAPDELTAKVRGFEQDISKLTIQIRKLSQDMTDIRSQDSKALEAEIDQIEKQDAAGTDQNIQSKLKQMRAQLAKMKESESTAEKIAELTAQNSELTKKLEEATATIKKNEQETWNKEVSSFIDKAVKDGKILPSQREMVKQMFEMAKNSGTLKFSKEGKEVQMRAEELIRSYIQGVPQVVVFGEVSPNGNGEDALGSGKKRQVTHGANTYEVEDDEMANEALEYSKKEKVPFDEALLIVEKRKKENVNG